MKVFSSFHVWETLARDDVVGLPTRRVSSSCSASVIVLGDLSGTITGGAGGPTLCWNHGDVSDGILKLTFKILFEIQMSLASEACELAN